MIVPMTRVRIMGPRRLLSDVLATVQDVGVLHLTSAPEWGPLHGSVLAPPDARRRRRTLSPARLAQARVVDVESEIVGRFLRQQRQRSGEHRRRPRCARHRLCFGRRPGAQAVSITEPLIFKHSRSGRSAAR